MYSQKGMENHKGVRVTLNQGASWRKRKYPKPRQVGLLILLEVKANPSG